MAVTLARCVLNDVYSLNLNFVRHIHRVRGKPPGVARNLQQRLEITNAKDELYTRIDIGLPPLRSSRSEVLSKRIQEVEVHRKDEKLEKLARNHKLFANLDEVKSDWLASNGPYHIKKVAEHYEIFEHLYSEGYFIPRVHLSVEYKLDGEKILPAFYGNVITPTEAKHAPSVNFKAEKDTLWTLMLTNLDGHLTKPGSEYVHWCISNIPEGNVDKGDTIVEYLRPIPPRGTGFHRFVFVLYKQNEKIDYSLSKVKCDSPLEERTFKTRPWYSEHQDKITPAGLAFFQSDWDPSLKDFYHHHLNMKEPVFEYDFDPPYIKPQTWFPKKVPFNLYMDKYRDSKQVAKEYLLLKLKNEHPFRKPEPALRFPNAQAFPIGMPSWLKLHERKVRLGWGRINDV